MAALTASMADLSVSDSKSSASSSASSSSSRPPAAAAAAAGPATPAVVPLAPAFSAAEHAAFRAVAAALTAPPHSVPAHQVRAREVAVVTMVSKLRVEKAVTKYKQFLDVLKEYGLTLDSFYEDAAELHAKLSHKWANNYQVCGVDNGGRAVMWIGSSEPTQVAEETTVVHAGIMYWMAVHSDLATLRDGCTFVIDTSKQGNNRVGNERKLQKTWQALPLRPQNLFIVGANFLKRLFINALIKFASVFSNSKVLARIQFVEMPEVFKAIPTKNMPHELGGDERCAVEPWVHARLRAFDGLSLDSADGAAGKNDKPEITL